MGEREGRWIELESERGRNRWPSREKKMRVFPFFRSSPLSRRNLDLKLGREHRDEGVPRACRSGSVDMAATLTKEGRERERKKGRMFLMGCMLIFSSVAVAHGVDH